MLSRRPKMTLYLQDGANHYSALRHLGFSASSAAEIASEAKEIAPNAELDRAEPGFAQLLSHLSEMPDVLSGSSITSCKRLHQDSDFLATNCWDIGFLKSLCLAANSKVAKRGFVAAVATIRNEGPFIVEWLAHHRAVGIETFFIYTNENTDGSLKLLRLLAKADVIRLIENDVARAANPQVKAYEHALCLNQECQSFRWLAYLDADEFVIPAARYDFRIEQLIRDLATRVEIGSISMNWMWMGSGGAVRRDFDRALCERFLIGKPLSLFVKSIVQPSSVLSMRSVHKPVLRPGYIGVNSAGDEIDMVDHSSPFNFDGGEIRHYWNKSYEEFLVKQLRGVDRDIWERDTDRFFDWDVSLEDGGAERLMPDCLSRRALEQVALIRALPGVSEAEAMVRKQYARIAESATTEMGVDEHYNLSRARHELRRILLQKQRPAKTSAVPAWVTRFDC